MPDADATEDHWRELAAQARQVAEQLTDPVAVRVLLRIAEAYDGLADRARFRSSRDDNKK
jgi:hypothetical protein